MYNTYYAYVHVYMYFALRAVKRVYRRVQCTLRRVSILNVVKRVHAIYIERDNNIARYVHLASFFFLSFSFA